MSRELREDVDPYVRQLLGEQAECMSGLPKPDPEARAKAIEQVADELATIFAHNRQSNQVS